MLYFFVALTVVALGYFVAWPLLGDSSEEANAASGAQLRSERVADDRTQLENALAEAEFDYCHVKHKP